MTQIVDTHDGSNQVKPSGISHALGSLREILGGALYVLACSIFLAASAHADTQTVTLFIGTTPDYANLYVTRDKGFFEAEGIKLDIRLFPSGTAATDGFRSGHVDFVSGGEIPSMRLCELLGAKVIAPLGYDGVSPIFMVKSSIKSPDDLRGKTIATRIGSSGELFVQLVRDKFKLPADAFKLINLEPTDMVAALDRGDIDGFLWFSPFDQRAIQISGSKVRLLMRGGEVGYTNEVVMVARGDLITSNPDLVIRFVRALAKGSEYATSHRDETVDIVSAALKIDKKDAEFTKQMTYPIRFDRRVYERYGTAAKFMLEKHFIEKPIDFDSCFWTKGVEAVDPARVEKR